MRVFKWILAGKRVEHAATNDDGYANGRRQHSLKYVLVRELRQL
jgi:hypothetical protein